ncbi:MAG: Magnesium transport protein CorA [Parcubacteria group bacterium ADurb.Bin216]|jgi:magnesium transporter|nr:MAG: Magnesium transport protein CorA [Parcubacteria group bacterium ADurb.Bin216]
MIEIFFKDIKKNKFQKIDKIRDGAWINIESVATDDLDYIAEIANLKRTDIEDILDPYEIPRVERHGDSVVLFVRDVSSGGDYDYTKSLAIIITDRYFITASLSKNRTIRAMINNEDDVLSTTQRTKLLITLLLLISKNYTKEIKNAKAELSLQKKSLSNVDNTEIVRLIEKEDILDQYISALIPMKNTIESIIQGNYIKLYTYDNELVEDLLIATRQLLDNCSATVKNIRSLREAYQAMLTNKLNDNISILTSLTVILTIPTIIASLFGMNVKLPFESEEWAFIMIVIIILSITTILYLVFKKKEWF